MGQLGGNPRHFKVLVLGATGLIGNAVVRELVARGHSVTGTCRRREDTPPNLDGLGMRTVHGDIDAPGQLETWIAGHEIVVDAAAPYPRHLLNIAANHRANGSDIARRRTELLISGLRRHKARLVHVSTVLARPGNPGPGASGLQRRAMRAIHPYFAVKSFIERRLLQTADQIPGVTIVQPAACLGPYDVKPREHCLLPKIVCGEVPISISHKINVIDTRDVAAGIASIIENENFGQVVQLSGHNTSIDDLLREIEAISGTAGPRWRYPAALGVLPSLWAEIMWATVGQRSPLPSLLPILICEQGWMQPGDEQRSLGLVPRPLRDTLRDAISWYRKLGYC